MRIISNYKAMTNMPCDDKSRRSHNLFVMEMQTAARNKLCLHDIFIIITTENCVDFSK